MERWAFFTLFIYVLLVGVVFLPLIITGSAVISDAALGFGDFFSLYQSGQFWIFCGAIFLAEAFLLMYPVKAAEEAPIPKRSVWVPIITMAFLFSVLLLGVVVSIAMAILGDGALFSYWMWGYLVFLVVGWVAWAWLFFCFIRNADPKACIRRILGWLIKGSVLELLVAVPSHIIVRRRDDCCAPAATSMAMAAGVIIMFLAFGPGLFFLFKERFEKMKPKSQREDLNENSSEA